jgi:hypothetical protein
MGLDKTDEPTNESLVAGKGWRAETGGKMSPRVAGTIVAATAFLTLCAGCGSNLAQQTTRPSDSGFSFAVYGDSRSMMYLPYRADQEKEARRLMVDMFELVLPAHVAEAVVEKDVKLTYDPATKELVQMVMPFDTAHEVTTLRLDKGWVTEASVEDVKLLPGVHRVMFRLQGGTGLPTRS